MISHLCGIDEAGRGPLAGDLVIAGVILTSDVEGLNDSKKLSEKKREALYDRIVQNAEYHIVSFAPSQIDSLGISVCLRMGLEEIMQTLQAKSYLFDGNSTFGVQNLETMVQADGKVSEVSAASILAKVTHDRAIYEQAKRFPEYGFEKHKGYGTKQHIEMIKKYGYCEVHRKSYKIKELREPSLF